MVSWGFALHLLSKKVIVWKFPMPYVRHIFTGDRARQIARFGTLSTKRLRPMPWWPEDTCARIEKIVWRVYFLGEAGEDWHEVTAYDNRDKVLGVHRMDGY
jgi:hypothetical protein